MSPTLRWRERRGRHKRGGGFPRQPEALGHWESEPGVRTGERVRM